MNNFSGDLDDDIDETYRNLMAGKIGDITASDFHKLLKISEKFGHQCAFGKAIDIIKFLTRKFPDIAHLFFNLAGLYAWIGDNKNQIASAGKFLDLIYEPLNKYPDLGVRVITYDWFIGNIGETADQLEGLIKGRLLGFLPVAPQILHAPPEKVVNDAMLKAFSSFVTIIEDPTDIDSEQSLRIFCPLTMYYVRLPRIGNKVFYKCQAYRFFHQKWEQEERGALLQLSESDLEKGRQELERLGLGPEDWFVCLHIREQGYATADGNDVDFNKMRNVEVSAYLPAIEEITRRGGWVIRLGGKHHSPLPQMPKVIDYPNLPDPIHGMEVFFCAKNKFFLGCTSGPSAIPKLFDRPVLLTDAFSLPDMNVASLTTILPKRVYSRSDRRYLRINELYDSPLTTAVHHKILEAFGLEVECNSPEQIRRAVIDFMASLDANDMTFGVNPEDQEKAESALIQQGTLLLGKFAPSFIADNPEWLEPPEKPWKYFHKTALDTGQF